MLCHPLEVLKKVNAPVLSMKSGAFMKLRQAFTWKKDGNPIVPLFVTFSLIFTALPSGVSSEDHTKD